LHARILKVIFSEFVFWSDDFVTSFILSTVSPTRTYITGPYEITMISSIIQINVRNCTMTSRFINIRETVLTSLPHDTRGSANDRQTYFLSDHPKSLDQHQNQETNIIRTSPPGREDANVYAVMGIKPLTCSPQVLPSILWSTQGR